LAELKRSARAAHVFADANTADGIPLRTSEGLKMFGPPRLGEATIHLQRFSVSKGGPQT